MAGEPARRDEGRPGDTAEHGEAIHLPGPSIWPLVVGVAVTLLAFGVVTSLVFTVVGALLLAWALAGWIGELRHD